MTIAVALEDVNPENLFHWIDLAPGGHTHSQSENSLCQNTPRTEAQRRVMLACNRRALRAAPYLRNGLATALRRCKSARVEHIQRERLLSRETRCLRRG